MELFINSLRNVLFGLIVLVLNIPVFWSFQGFIDFIKNALKLIGLDF